MPPAAWGIFFGLLPFAFAWTSLPTPGWKPAFEKRTLDGGLRIILDRDESSETTVVKILVKGGRLAEPEGKTGLSFLTTRLAVEIPDDEKARALLGMASAIEVTSQADFSLITLGCLSSNLDPTLRILAKIISDPLFTGFRIDAIKEFMRHRSRLEQDDSAVAGHLECLKAFFATPGYAGSIYGQDQTIKTIKGREISEFYRRYFRTGNMIVAISSNLAEEELIPLIERFLAGLAKGDGQAENEVAVRRPSERTVFLRRETRQSYVSLAYPLPAISGRGYALACLLESILGKGPGSRLWTLRADEQLAYNVNCRATLMAFGGILEAYLETDANKMEKARTELKSLLAALAENGIDHQELEMAKSVCRANFLRDNETKEGRISTLAVFEALGLGCEYFNDFQAEIKVVEVEEMNAFLRSVLDVDKAFEVVIGPEAQPRERTG